MNHSMDWQSLHKTNLSFHLQNDYKADILILVSHVSNRIGEQRQSHRALGFISLPLMFSQGEG